MYSISPQQAYSFCCWFLQQFRSTLLLRMPFQALLWQKLAFSSPFFYFNHLSSISLSLGGIVLLLSSNILVLLVMLILFVAVFPTTLFDPSRKDAFASSFVAKVGFFFSILLFQLSIFYSSVPKAL